MLNGTITPSAEIAIERQGAPRSVNGHWSKRVKLDHGENSFVVYIRA
jgi:hypothetical protein